MKVYVLKVLVHFRTPKFTFTVKLFFRDEYLFARVLQMIVVENHCSMCSSKILHTHLFGNSPDAALSKLLLTNR
jgi:hypothetical protein